MTRILLSGLLVGGLVVGLWLSVSSGPRRASAGAAASTAPGPALEAAPTAPVVELLAPAASLPAELETAAAPAAVASERQALPAADAALDDLIVSVVDSLGAPVSGIALRLRGPTEGSTSFELRTDENGRAVFPRVRAMLARAAEPWTLRHALPFEDARALVLDRARLADPVVVFVLPDGGAIEVLVRDLEGRPAPDGTEIELALLHDRKRLEGRWRTRSEGGRALFPWVELDRTWELLAWMADATVPSVACARGPRALREQTQIVVVLGADHPIVSFRVLDALGSPLANADLELLRRGFIGFTTTARARTDQLARFIVDADSSPFAERSFLVRHAAAGDTWIAGRIEIPRDVVPGWNDGGDIVLAEPAILVAGWVVDETGAPVAGAEVVAARQVDDPVARHYTVQLTEITVSNTRIRSGDRVQGVTDERGRFELRGLLNESEFELRAEMGFLRSKTLRVHESEREARLELRPSGSASGTLLVDPGQPVGSVGVLARDVAQDVHVDARLFDDGSFGFDSLLAGTYDFLFSLDGEPLFELPGIAVRAEVDLGTIDLRGRMRVNEIVLVGAPEPADLSTKVHWRPSGSSADWQERTVEGSSIAIASSTLPIDVWVEPSGYRRALLERVSGRRELELQAPLRVRLVLRTSGALPQPPYALYCLLRHGPDDVGALQDGQRFSEENRELVFLVSEPGPTRVRWALEKRFDYRFHFEGGGGGGSGTTAGEVLEDHELEIDVLDVPGEQVFPVELDGAALQALVNEPPW
jgi:hypothetical protein